MSGARRTWLALSAVAALVSAPTSTQAQLDARTKERIRAFEARIDLAAWTALANADCPVVAGDAEAVARDYVARLTRGLPPPKLRTVRNHDLLVRRRGVRIDQVEVHGRIDSTAVRILIGEPDVADSMAPTVLLLPAPGILAHQAFGIRFAGDDSLLLQKEPALFWGVAREFLDAGMRVAVVDLSDDILRGAYLPWQNLARQATLHRRRTPEMSLATPTMGLLLGALDYLTDSASRGIVVGGWGDAALLAGVLATDPRVTGLLWLAPPMDRPAARHDPQQIREQPTILAGDCGVSEVALSRLIIPKPQLLTWVAPADSVGTTPAHRASTAIADSIASAYALRGVPERFRHAPLAARAEWRGTLHAWLALQGLAPLERQAGRSASPSSANVRPYPARQLIDLVFFNNGTAVGPGCRQRTITPDRSSQAAFLGSVEALRTAMRREVTRTRRPEPIRWRIDTLGSTSAFSLISYADADRPDGSAGIVAIPTSGTQATPAVISYNGYDGAIPFFDRRQRAPTEYLNAAGAVLAERGYVVVMPAIASWFPDGAGSFLEARTADRFAAWSRMLESYEDGLTFALRELRVDSANVTGYGISFGGEALLTHAALDSRVQRILYNNPTSSPDSVFRHPDAAGLASWQSAICEYETALREVLIAPRPFVWENGLFDSNGSSEDPLRSVQGVRSVYEALSAADRFFFVRHGGAHATRPNTALLDLLRP